ncbi:MAG: arylsulfatase [Planctomycetaceae bacterium]|nr:arylsulfatase [Planctomycetaceae bacterium]
MHVCGNLVLPVRQALLMICSFALLTQVGVAESLPNILIILADDLGYGDVQCYNRDRGKIPTPNIDGLASGGMRFTDGHSSSGVCSPSRYALLTGRYHWRSRLQRGIVGVWERPLIPPDRLTIGKVAQQAGYRTACIGKWHLGSDWPITDEQKTYFIGLGGKAGGGGNVVTTVSEAHREAWRTVFSQRIPGGPTERGFDHYFGTDVPNWPPYCFIDGDRTAGIPSELLPADKLVKNQASLQGPALPNWQLEPILPALAERAEKFIAEQAATKQPFLLYMPLTSPHTPLAVNAPWKNKSGLNSDYADFVMETDAAVGRVLKALADAGAADNTLLFFTSDNGCASYIGVKDLEAQGHFPSGPLRGYKTDAWEGGHRVPFIVRWPGVTAPGSVCRQLVHQADIIRTAADVLGVDLPEDSAEDSFSLLPLLKGDEQPVRRHAVSASSGGVPAVRSDNWKYIAGPASGRDNTGPVQLYNLAEDLGETSNLAEAMPEKVAQMQSLLEELITNGRSTPGPRQPNDVPVRRFPVRTNNNKTKAGK